MSSDSQIHERCPLVCKMALTWRIGLILLEILVSGWAAVAQQQYNNPDGYTCNGRYKTCSTYALYRAQDSLRRVASYFNVTELQILNASGLITTALDYNAALPRGQPLYIPLDCSCQNGTSQMVVSHTMVYSEKIRDLLLTIYGGLTTKEATGNLQNHVTLHWGDVLRVPIFCACPTAEQIANGTKFLLTYSAIYPQNETLEVISRRYGVPTAELMAANEFTSNTTLRGFQWLPNTTLLENLTLLVPLVSLPPIEILSSTNPKLSRRRKDERLIVGVSAGTAAALLIAIGFFTVRRSSRKEGELSLVDGNLVPRMFTYKELRKATKNFKRSELLGSGGFGAVYKGTLPSGALVAVKRMRMESKHGKESFQAEVATLSHIRHRNLVQLRGWCHGADELLLVYDYMCNGSLDEWLFQSSHLNQDQETLPLNLRHSVLSGVAAALAYLHEECAQCVLHRDVKSSNVLLDGYWNAYLGDFGLARLIDHHKLEKTTMMAGTFGNMAPEMPHTGRASKESDVYSFGVLMLEVVCGKRALHVSAAEQGEGMLVNRVWRAHEAGDILEVADSRILEAFPPPNENILRSLGGIEVQEAASVFLTEDMQNVNPTANFPLDGAMEDKKVIRNLLHLGLLCCNPNPEDRPSMRFVSQLLQMAENMELSLPPLSDHKPRSYLSWSGFSEVVVPWSTSSGSNVQAGAERSESQSSSHSNFQASFAAPDSSVFSGR